MRNIPRREDCMVLFASIKSSAAIRAPPQLPSLELGAAWAIPRWTPEIEFAGGASDS